MTLEVLRSDLLSPVRHGFFTRKGGASSGIFSGLNCGQGSSDQAEMVAINRARVAEAMGGASEDLRTVHQIHSSEVLIVAGAQPAPRPRADAMVSADPMVILGILTADCQPVLFWDPESGIVGAAHAGWTGALSGILEATVDAMVGIGANRGTIRASIGPTISQSAYEVGPEFRDRFLSDDPGNARFFSPGEGDRTHFDLPAYGLHRLQKTGIEDAHWTHHCTYSDPERFYSYRRSVHRREADYGRLIATIRAVGA